MISIHHHPISILIHQHCKIGSVPLYYWIFKCYWILFLYTIVCLYHGGIIYFYIHDISIIGIYLNDIYHLYPFISIISRCFDHRELRQHCRAPQPYDVGLWLHRGGRRGRGQRRWGLAAQRPQRPWCFVGRFKGISGWFHDEFMMIW